MRIINLQTIETWASAQAGAKTSLSNWTVIVQAAKWASFADVRQTFGSADQVRVASGRTAIVFAIAGNRFRLIAAVHYAICIVFALRFVTYAGYSKDPWQDEL